jgi:hypothetical protein
VQFDALALMVPKVLVFWAKAAIGRNSAKMSNRFNIITLEL